MMQQPATPFHHRALANRRKEVDTSDSPKGQNQTLQKTGLLPSGIVNSKVAKLLSFFAQTNLPVCTRQIKGAYRQRTVQFCFITHAEPHHQSSTCNERCLRPNRLDKGLSTGTCSSSNGPTSHPFATSSNVFCQTISSMSASPEPRTSFTATLRTRTALAQSSSSEIKAGSNLPGNMCVRGVIPCQIRTKAQLVNDTQIRKTSGCEHFTKKQYAFVLYSMGHILMHLGFECLLLLIQLYCTLGPLCKKNSLWLEQWWLHHC